MIAVQGDGLRAVVDPRRGAKIVSLVDSRGIEWLSQRAEAAVAPGSAFVESEMAGWDECAPSIISCTSAGRTVPDHGDLWDTVFEISGSAVIGHGGGYTFQRSISEVAGGLRLGYRAEATGEELPFLWAAHPQFVAPRGTRVVLPEQVTRVVDVMADPIVPMPWAVELSTIDTVPLGAGRKVYVDPDSDITAATLLRPEGARLELTWSSECQYLGLWFDNSQYSREPVIALEPATGYFDSVERAADAGRVSILEPGRPLEWWIEVRCS